MTAPALTGWVARREPLTRAIRDAIRDATAWPTEVGRVPDGAEPGEPPAMPYVIVYPLDGEWYGPPMTSEADASFPYQCTIVGDDALQLEAAADRLRSVLLEPDAARGQHWLRSRLSDGMTIMGRWGASAGAIDATGTLLQVPERYVFAVTSS